MKNNMLTRSLMFVPANNLKYLTSASRRNADVFLLDCEDSVPSVEKDIARNNVISFINKPENLDKIVFPRINECDGNFFLNDILSLTVEGISGFMCPKINKSDDIKFIDRILKNIEISKGFHVGYFKLIPLIETPLGIINLQEIAASSERIVALAFGCEDYLSETKGIKDSGGMSIQFARDSIVNVARAYELSPIDTVHTNVHDKDDLEKNLTKSKILGFDGMLVINPKELDAVNHAYSPSEDEYCHAMEILSLFEEAKRQGKGEAILNGKFVGPPMAKKAKDIVDKYNMISQNKNIRPEDS